MSKIIPLNDGWQFTEKFSEKLLKEDCNCELTEVRIPHTVKETPYHYFDESVYQMVSGYRRILRAEKAWSKKRVFLRFDGVAHTATVYVNGEQVCEHRCGYTAFEAELTDVLRYGEENVITVKVDSRESQDIPPFGNVIDYMTYGGIYREVTLTVTGEVRIGDLWARPEAPAGSIPDSDIKRYRFTGILCPEITIGLSDNVDRRELTIDAQILDHQTRKVLKTESHPFMEFPNLSIPNAQLWDITAPFLYDLHITLKKGSECMDEKTVTFGFRRSEFKKDGFYLNGRKLKLRGLNRHQSYPYVGYAMPASQQRFDADILRKELGCNAVRTSHYPQSQHFVDRCDELGLLVFTEFPGWQHIGNEAWKEQVLINEEEMIEQYRNHPSVILWGVRINESVDDDELYTKTNALAHRLDPDRPTGGVRYLEKSHLLEDVYTFNDFSHYGSNAGCKKKKTVTPDPSKPYLISEYNGHMFPTKAFDDEEHRLEQALRHANVLESVGANRDIAGSFGWCMFDYNTHKDFGSGDRICYHGVADMFRNPKLAAYVYASQQNRVPVLEVSSSMDIGEHPAGNRGQIWIFTNADSVKMYCNDVLLKEYTEGDPKYSHLRHAPIAIDDYVGDRIKEEGFEERQEKIVKEAINYIAQYGLNNIPVRIKARLVEAMTVYRMTFEEAYQLYGKYVGNWGGQATTYRFEAIKDGNVVKTITKTTMSRLTLEVDVDHTELVEDATYDVAAIRIRVCDEYSNVQPFFHTPLPLKAEGPIAIIGPSEAQIAGGMGGTYIKTTGKKGKAALTVSLPKQYSYMGDISKTITFQIGRAPKDVFEDYGW